jgi:hypothetical protein
MQKFPPTHLLQTKLQSLLDIYTSHKSRGLSDICVGCPDTRGEVSGASPANGVNRVETLIKPSI